MMSSILKAARDSSSLSPCHINGGDQSIDISVSHLVFNLTHEIAAVFFNIVQKAIDPPPLVLNIWLSYSLNLGDSPLQTYVVHKSIGGFTNNVTE